MKKWNEISPFTGSSIGEDAPTNSAGSGSVAGDYVSMVSDGSKWYIVDSCMKVTTNGLAFRSS